MSLAILARPRLTSKSMRSWNSRPAGRFQSSFLDQWKDEFGNTLEGGVWPGLQANIEKVPVWMNGHIVLHVYKRNWTSFFKRNLFHAIYVQNEPYALATAQICWANARTLGCPLGFPPARISSRSIRLRSTGWRPWFIGKVLYAFPITEAVEEVLRSKKFQGRSTVCALPLDPEIYRPRGVGEDRKLIPRADDEVIIGYVGRIVEPKGLRTLGRCAALLE